LAQALGVAKPTLYVHGTSKESLFLSAIESEVERVADRIQAAESATAGRAAHDRAQAFALALLDYAAARPAGARLLMHTAHHESSRVAGAVADALTRIPDRIAELLRRDLASDGLDPQLAAQMARCVFASALTLGEGRRGERRPSRARLAALAASVVPLPPAEAAGDWPTA
jgi:AcrR family transcriptional regulator